MDLSGLLSSGEVATNELILLFIFTNNTLQIIEAGVSHAVNLNSLQDMDEIATNELNTSLILNGTRLELTDPGGTLAQDLASLVAGNANPADELITTLELNQNVLTIVEGGDGPPFTPVRTNSVQRADAGRHHIGRAGHHTVQHQQRGRDAVGSGQRTALHL